MFWRRDPDFVPEKDKKTVRLLLSSPSGVAWEVLVTGLKWFDVRAGKGGGGGIDLVIRCAANLALQERGRIARIAHRFVKAFLAVLKPGGGLF